MLDHHELVAEMPSVERMSTQDRLKHAKKRRVQQLKKFSQYEKQLDKETSKKRKSGSNSIDNRKSARQKRNVVFVPNIALLEAAARKDVEEVRQLLMKGVSPDLTNDDGLTALHQCCIDDSEEMLVLLLEYGAKVNAKDSEQWTPLHAAATCGHAHLCKHLVERGAELLSVNADGNMPYDICEDERTLDYIETEMAKRGITQDDIDEKRIETEKRVLDDLESIADTKYGLEFRDHMGATPLHISAANGYLEVAQYLLDNHVSVNARDNDSWQPIHAAAYWGQPDLVDILVQNGADIDAKTRNGETPFDLCEDPELKQKILDVKDEIESNKATRGGKPTNIKHRISTRSASMRRSSLRGDKARMSLKEAKEEALHFGLRTLQDDDDLPEIDENKENVPATNIDDVEIIVDDQHNVNQDRKSYSVDIKKESTIKKASPSPPQQQSHPKQHHQSPDDNYHRREKDNAERGILEYEGHPVKPSTVHSSNITPATISPTTTMTTTNSSTTSKVKDLTEQTIKPAAVPTKPAAVPTKPASVPTKPASVPTKPASVPTKPAAVPTKPAAVPTKPAAVPTKPAAVPTKPAAVPTKPAAVPTKPAAVPTKPAAVPTKPVQTKPVSPPTPKALPPAVLEAQSRLPEPIRPPSHPHQPPPTSSSSGSTLNDLKRHRAGNRRDTIDAQVQSMFVERANNNWQNPNSSSPNDKTVNGHNNNNSPNSYSQETVHRFVAPTDIAIIGEDDKQNCCVVM